jgi:glycosyltransferase involved in cell wall biosynthesis
MPEHAMPSVAVIVPVKDDESRLRICLAALDSQDYPGPFEVIVIDNGSASPPDTALVACSRARLINEPAPGPYAARNRAALDTDAEVLAFTDADCQPEPSWLSEGVRALSQAGNRAFVGGAIAVYATDPSRPSAAELYELVTAFQQRRYIEEGQFAATANLFLRAAAFAEVGDFDDRLLAGGDREWGQRATRAGYRGQYADAAVVRHPARPTLAELRRKRRRIERGRSKQRIIEDRMLGVTELIRGFRPPVRGMWQYARAVPEPTVGRMLRVASVTAALHYTSAWHQLRLWPGERRARRHGATTGSIRQSG